MKRWLVLGLVLGGAAIFLASAAGAQENSKAEIFGGYSYVHINDRGTASLNGGSGSVAVNPTGWLGAVADFGGYEGSASGLNGNLFTYLFGPRVSLRRGRITPFVQALFGGAHTSADPPPQQNAGALAHARPPEVRPLTMGVHPEIAVAGGGTFASSNTFAMAAGGGVDLNATQHIGVRLFQAEYLLTEFKDGIHNRQNDARVSAGIVFRF